jgi:hypothetical protein
MGQAVYRLKKIRIKNFVSGYRFSDAAKKVLTKRLYRSAGSAAPPKSEFFSKLLSRFRSRSRHA